VLHSFVDVAKSHWLREVMKLEPNFTTCAASRNGLELAGVRHNTSDIMEQFLIGSSEPLLAAGTLHTCRGQHHAQIVFLEAKRIQG